MYGSRSGASAVVLAFGMTVCFNLGITSDDCVGRSLGC